MALNINGRMKVKTLRKDFKSEFGLSLRLYDGRSFADDEATLASIRKGDSKGGEFSPKRNTKVGNLEDKILEMFGIKVQVSGSDDSYLCDNDKTLAGALEADELLMAKKKKKKNISENSNVLSKSNEDEITIKKVIEEIKVTYSGHDDLDEIITDLQDNISIDYWAEYMFQEKFNNNKELAKKLFTVYLNTLESSFSSDYLNVAELVSSDEKLSDKEWGRELFVKALELAEDNNDKISIANAVLNKTILNDKNWAIEIFKQVEVNLEELSDYNDLIESTFNDLQDKQWGEKLVKEAISKVNDTKDIYKFMGMPCRLLTLAETVAVKNGLDDKEAAKLIFDKQKEFENIPDLIDSARKVQEIYGNDDYALEYSESIIQRVTECLKEGYYCDLYYFIKEDLLDEDRAIEYKDKYEAEMRNDSEMYETCEGLFDDEFSVDFNDTNLENYNKGNVLLCIHLQGIEDRLDNEGLTDTEEGLILVRQLIIKFVNMIKEKFEFHIHEKVLLLNEDGIFIDLDTELNGFKYVEGEPAIYLVLTKNMPEDDINALFLSLSDDFYMHVYMPNCDGDIIQQNYQYGELDSGFFFQGAESQFINFDNNLSAIEHYEKAKSILIAHE